MISSKGSVVLDDIVFAFRGTSVQASSHALIKDVQIYSQLRKHFEERHECESETRNFLFSGEGQKIWSLPKETGFEYNTVSFYLWIRNASFRFVGEGFHGSSFILNFVTISYSDLAGRSSIYIAIICIH